MKEKFITQKPSNYFLQKYISYYYFHNSSNHEFHKKFIYYPNFKNALTIYKNSSVEFSDNHSISKPNCKTDFSFIYSGVQNQFRTAEIISPFDKIGIVFQELGINHFIEVPLSTISNHPIQMSFNYFGNNFIQLCQAVYNEEDLENKIKLLDNYFINHFIDFQEKTLKNCINLILNSKHKITVHELSKKCGVNRKSLLRLFKKHLCCTTKDYIDIVQFRGALNDYLQDNKRLSFTEIALENEYYDQAQFINHIKKLTGINPKKFFKNIKHLGNEDTFWAFK